MLVSIWQAWSCCQLVSQKTTPTAYSESLRYVTDAIESCAASQRQRDANRTDVSPTSCPTSTLTTSFLQSSCWCCCSCFTLSLMRAHKSCDRRLHLHLTKAVAIVTTLQPVKHRWLKITLTLTLNLTLTVTYTRSPMFDRLQRRNNSHSVYTACGWIAVECPVRCQ